MAKPSRIELRARERLEKLQGELADKRDQIAFLEAGVAIVQKQIGMLEDLLGDDDGEGQPRTENEG